MNASLKYEIYDEVALFQLTEQKAATKLICFPYAGGSATLFQKLDGQLRSEVEVWSVEGPGHFYTTGIAEDNLDLLTTNYLRRLPRSLWQDNIVLYGHSLGAYVACDMAGKLIKQQYSPKLILSGAPPPNRLFDTIRFSALAPEELLPLLSSFNKDAHRLLENPELFNFFTDMLYADFKAFESFTFPQEIANVCPLIIAGYEDRIYPAHSFFDWQLFFENIKLDFVSGGHLFIDEFPQQVAHKIDLFIEESN